MEKKRYIDYREHRFSISEPTPSDPTLIVCPKCTKMARVILYDQQPEIGYIVKAVCTHCGFTNQKTGAERAFYWHEEEPSDGYFGYRLWLKTPCCGNSLWAFNIRHLELIESYVMAEIRENPKDGLGYANSSIASRLPKWIKSSKNREQVLSCIHKLKQMANNV